MLIYEGFLFICLFVKFLRNICLFCFHFLLNKLRSIFFLKTHRKMNFNLLLLRVSQCIFIMFLLTLTRWVFVFEAEFSGISDREGLRFSPPGTRCSCCSRADSLETWAEFSLEGWDWATLLSFDCSKCWLIIE